MVDELSDKHLVRGGGCACPGPSLIAGGAWQAWRF